MGRTVMGYWTCPHCNTTGIEGLTKVCPNCGAGVDKSVRYYMDPAKPVYLNQSQSVGPDWYCSHCEKANKVSTKTCKHCGADKGVSKNYFDITGMNPDKVYVSKDDFSVKEHYYSNSTYKSNDQGEYRIEPDYKIEEYYTKEGTLDSESNNLEESSSSILSTEKIKTIYNYLLPAGVGFIAILVIYFFIQAMQPKLQQLTVEHYNWEREVQVQSLQTVWESDWYLPYGARLEYITDEIHHYNEVFSHNETRTNTYTENVLVGYNTVVTGYSDNGDGTFTEITSSDPIYQTELRIETYDEPIYISVPVYESKYYYNIDRWLYSHSLYSSGSDCEPYWNEPVFGELEKELKRSESYTIDTTNKKDKQHNYKLEYGVWNDLREKEIHEIEVYINILGNLSFEK